MPLFSFSVWVRWECVGSSWGEGFVPRKTSQGLCCVLLEKEGFRAGEGVLPVPPEQSQARPVWVQHLQSTLKTFLSFACSGCGLVLTVSTATCCFSSLLGSDSDLLFPAEGSSWGRELWCLWAEKGSELNTCDHAQIRVNFWTNSCLWAP